MLFGKSLSGCYPTLLETNSLSLKMRAPLKRKFRAWKPPFSRGKLLLVSGSVYPAIFWGEHMPLYLGCRCFFGVSTEIVPYHWCSCGPPGKCSCSHGPYVRPWPLSGLAVYGSARASNGRVWSIGMLNLDIVWTSWSWYGQQKTTTTQIFRSMASIPYSIFFFFFTFNIRRYYTGYTLTETKIKR